MPREYETQPGKKKGQKYKSLLVMQYLLKHADDETPVTIDELNANCKCKLDTRTEINFQIKKDVL